MIRILLFQLLQIASSLDCGNETVSNQSFFPLIPSPTDSNHNLHCNRMWHYKDKFTIDSEANRGWHWSISRWLSVDRSIDWWKWTNILRWDSHQYQNSFNSCSLHGWKGCRIIPCHSWRGWSDITRSGIALQVSIWYTVLYTINYTDSLKCGKDIHSSSFLWKTQFQEWFGTDTTGTISWVWYFIWKAHFSGMSTTRRASCLWISPCNWMGATIK